MNATQARTTYTKYWCQKSFNWTSEIIWYQFFWCEFETRKCWVFHFRFSFFGLINPFMDGVLYFSLFTSYLTAWCELGRLYSIGTHKYCGRQRIGDKCKMLSLNILSIGTWHLATIDSKIKLICVLQWSSQKNEYNLRLTFSGLPPPLHRFFGPNQCTCSLTINPFSV